VKFLLALLTLMPLLAWSASFDCQKARNTTERSICADPQLSSMDQEMGNAYQQVLSTTQNVNAWQADQRAWLRKRDDCKSDLGCLRSTYMERLVVLRAARQPFRWDTHWWRVDASSNASDTNSADFTINGVTKQGLSFDIYGQAGTHSGEFEGRASFIDADTARYRGNADDGTEECTLTFKRVLNRLEVEGNASDCYAASGVYYQGTYVASDQNPNTEEPDLISRGVLSSAKLDRAFRKLVGKDYENFVHTANMISGPLSDTLNGRPVTSITLFVRGGGCDQSIILYDDQGHLWAALWQYTDDDASADSNQVNTGLHYYINLRYYTNVDSDSRTLPAPIQNMNCPDAKVHMMS